MNYPPPPETPLGKALDRRRAMHGEVIRRRLTLIQDEAGCLSLNDIVSIAREAFVAGASAMGEILLEEGGSPHEVIEFREPGLPANVVRIPNLTQGVWHG